MSISGAGVLPTFRVKYEGADIIDYRNPHTSVSRDKVVDSLLPREVCACAIGRAIDARDGTVMRHCMRPETIAKIAQGYGHGHDHDHDHSHDHSHDHDHGHDDSFETLRTLMARTHCTDEKCVLDTAAREHAISLEDAGIEEQIAFKRAGPTDTSLFNDSVIHAQMFAWMYQFAPFWAYNFNMLDYATSSMRNGRVVRKPDTLATVNWRDLYEGRAQLPPGISDDAAQSAASAMIKSKRANGVRCTGCIINGDVYDGNGKHWMALFADARDEGTRDRAPSWTIEFFNSAAVRPESEWLVWMAKTKREMLEINPRAQVSYVYVCKLWHQHSTSECGPYSLFYVWARLNGVSPQYFLENPVPDQIMFEFRQHLFARDDTGGARAFNFQEYKSRVRIKWDAEKI